MKTEQPHIEVKKYNVVLTLTSEILGSLPKNREVASDYVLSKGVEKGLITQAEADAEVLTLEDLKEKGYTGFMSYEDKLCFGAYAIRGFLKNAATVLKTTVDIKNPKSKIDNHVFVYPRYIPFIRENKPIGAADGVIERPLKAMTMQGPRVSLAKSDMLQDATTLSFQLHVVASKDFTLKTLALLLSYGQYCGIGQWRNGGYGRFTYTIAEAE